MAHIQDRWYRKRDGRKVPSSRHGVAKRWRVRYLANGEEVSDAFEKENETKARLHQIEDSRRTRTFVDPVGDESWSPTVRLVG